LKKIFEIYDKPTINGVLDRAKFGTLALVDGSRAYSVPVNFVSLDGYIYFHGASKGRKMSAIKQNANVGFSVVESCSVIASYFSSSEGLACPATHFFKSISIDGRAGIVSDRDEKARMFEALMLKYQPEGGYKSFTDSVYDKSLAATAVVKIEIEDIKAKFKLGQHLKQERFDMIIEHLEERGSSTDIETAKLMREYREQI